MSYRALAAISSRYTALLLFLIALPLQAQEPGRVVGVARDAETGHPLPGAEIRISGGSLVVRADAEGRLVFPRVPSGSHEIVLSYIGREPAVDTVSVAGGNEVSLQMNARVLPVVLEGIDVRASRMMVQAEALSRQRTAPNIQNIVASDQFGRFPDASAPDAVQRIPGVSIARDQGEGRYIQIRGGSAANTLVTFNGIQVPSPEGDVRQIALDAVPVDILESIEVSKAILPDMDADAIGGAVNLVTKRAPSSRLFIVESSGGFSPLRSEPSGSGSFTLGDRSAGGGFGYILSGSYSRRNFGSDDLEPSYDFGDEGIEDDLLEELEIRHYSLWRERIGLNASLDFRLSETSSLGLTGIFSSMTDQEQRRNFVSVLEDDALEWLHKNREESLRTYNLSLSGNHLGGGGAAIDYSLSWARSLEDTPFDTEIAFIREGVAFSPDLSNPDEVRSNPSSIGGPFLFNEIEPASSNTENTDITGSFNLNFPIGGESWSGRLRTGVRIRQKEKIQELTEEAYELTSGELVLGQDVGSAWSETLRYPGSYDLPGFSTTPGDVTSFVSRFANQLEGESVIEADTEDYDLSERVLAGYVMAEVNLSPRFLLLPGFRYEHTAFEGAGFSWDSDTEELTPTSTDRSYSNLFPMVHARFALDRDTNLRAAFTTAIARPNFFDLIPYRIRDDEDLVLGNPELLPTLSRNFDLLVERYDERVGVMTAGIFYKQISDPIFVFVEENMEGGETEQPGNGTSAWIRGAEIALQKQLGGGVGIYANYTYTDSEATLPGGRKAPLQGQSDHVFNTALSFERGGFFAQASLNFHNEYVDEYAEEAFEDAFIARHTRIDGTASYRFGRASVFLEIVNLTNEPLIAYRGVRDRPIQMEYYQVSGRFGVRMNW